MDLFLESNVNNLHDKLSNLNKIKLTLKRNKINIKKKNKLINFYYNSLIQNHSDTEGIEYVRKKLSYDCNNIHITKQEEIYKDYLRWTNNLIDKKKQKSKQEFINFLNTIFKPMEFGREGNIYFAYMGISFKKCDYFNNYLTGNLEDYLEDDLEDGLDGSIYCSQFT